MDCEVDNEVEGGRLLNAARAEVDPEILVKGDTLGSDDTVLITLVENEECADRDIEEEPLELPDNDVETEYLGLIDSLDDDIAVDIADCMAGEDDETDGDTESLAILVEIDVTCEVKLIIAVTVVEG